MSTAKMPAESRSTDAYLSVDHTSRGRLLWGGVVLAVALIPVFMLQVFWAKALITPWYLPIGGTIAALVVLRAARQKRRWWAWGVALLCLALAGFEWFFLLGLTVLPRYSGPLAEGSAMPAFHATLADGGEIDASYFQRGRPTAVVFFQGRWCPFCMTQLRELEEHHAQFEKTGAEVVVVSIEDVEAAAQTKRDFPHLAVVSDERREFSDAIDVINKHSAPDGGDSTAPTILLVDGQGKIQWLHRPTRFIARPSAAELVAHIARFERRNASQGDSQRE